MSVSLSCSVYIMPIILLCLSASQSVSYFSYLGQTPPVFRMNCKLLSAKLEMPVEISCFPGEPALQGSSCVRADQTTKNRILTSQIDHR